jgi:hypothetical protein
LAKSLESVVFIEKAANFSLKLLIFRDFCKNNLLIIKCLTIEFYFLSSTKIPDNLNIYWKSHKASKHYSTKDLM